MALWRSGVDDLQAVWLTGHACRDGRSFDYFRPGRSPLPRCRS